MEKTAVKQFRISGKNKDKWITFAMVIIAFAVVSVLSNMGMVSRLIRGQLVPICAYVVMAVSLNLTVGILGELSLGHAGFMSVGAFSGVVAATALTASVPNPSLRLLIAIVVGGIFASIAGLLIGIPVLRLKGDYLAIVTLAFGEILKSLMNNLYIGMDSAGRLHFSMVNDSISSKLALDGKMIIEGPMGVSGNKKIATFFAGFLLVMFCLFVIYNLIDSKSGRAILALRDNSIAAESVGISITKFKLMAFTISAGMAGMAGALFAMNYSTVVAGKFDFNTSILVLVFVVLGGLGNLRGSIISATLLTVLPELLRKFADYRMLLYAICLILIMIFTNNPRMTGYFGGLKESFLSVFRRKNKDGGNQNG